MRQLLISDSDQLVHLLSLSQSSLCTHWIGKNDAFLTSTHNLCFEVKKKYQNVFFYLKMFIFHFVYLKIIEYCIGIRMFKQAPNS